MYKPAQEVLLGKLTSIVFTGPLSSKTNKQTGVVGCGEDVYLTSLGCPTDTGLQLGKSRYPYSR